jgi:RNA polymerase sigma factor (TIGR02999 family)
MALASTMIRRILVDHARTRSRQKRGGDAQRVTLAEVEPIAGDAPASSGMDLLALDEALDRLATKDPLGARVVEMRYFAGLDMDQVASALGVAPRTAKYHWASSRAWLREALTP